MWIGKFRFNWNSAREPIGESAVEGFGLSCRGFRRAIRDGTLAAVTVGQVFGLHLFSALGTRDHCSHHLAGRPRHVFIVRVDLHFESRLPYFLVEFLAYRGGHVPEARHLGSYS